MALTKAKLMELIDNGDIDVGGGGGQNILHNWDFRNPVNQRGISGAYIEPLYTIDRWVKTNYATITFNANSLDFMQYGILEQRFEGHGLAGKVVTFSLDVGGTITAVTTSFPTSTGEIIAYIGSNWEIKTMYTAGYMAVWFASLVAVSDIRRVKLELGTVSTLAYDPPMDHAIEQLKCQRFFFLLGTKQREYARFPNAVAVGSTLLGCYVQFPSRMRNIPTFYYTGSLSEYASVAAISFTDITMTDDGVSEGGAFIYFATSGVTDGHVYSIRAFNSTNASLCFSADL